MFVFAEHRDGKQAVINSNDGLISHNCSLVAFLYVTPLLTYPQLPYLIKIMRVLITGIVDIVL